MPRATAGWAGFFGYVNSGWNDASAENPNEISKFLPILASRFVVLESITQLLRYSGFRSISAGIVVVMTPSKFAAATP
jgi:hypothetical protein